MATFIDLSESFLSEIQCDICIVGAGAAGCFLASYLSKYGADVVLLEAGGRSCLMPEEVGFLTEFTASVYQGATIGRAMGIGGSTSRWGGLLIPHGLGDLRGNEDATWDPWSHIVSTVTKRSDTVLEFLGYGKTGRFESFPHSQFNQEANLLLRAGLVTLASLFLPFRLKNLAFLLRKANTLKIIYNAVANKLQFDNHSNGWRIRGLVAISKKGQHTVVVNARRFVLAAGALESTRMLLSLGWQGGEDYRPNTDLGRYLGDHLSIAIADVPKQSFPAVVRNFAPRFDGGWMRSFRFIEHEVNVQSKNPRAFAHFIFDNKSPGFALAKKVLTALQLRRMPAITGGEIVNGITGILALGAERYFGRRLHIPVETPVSLHLDIEQTPNFNNRVSLSDAKDEFGRRIPRLCWAINDADMEYIQLTSRCMLKRWNSSGLPTLEPRPLDSIYTKPHDAYHPVGTCRMGRDKKAVVDECLKVWGIDNLWLASTAVFPTAGTANPTFSLLCLTLELAESLLALSSKSNGK